MLSSRNSANACTWSIKNYWTPEQVIDPTMQAVSETVQTKEGLKEQTIKYLRDYQYGDALATKLTKRGRPSGRPLRRKI